MLRLPPTATHQHSSLRCVCKPPLSFMLCLPVTVLYTVLSELIKHTITLFEPAKSRCLEMHRLHTAHIRSVDAVYKAQAQNHQSHSLTINPASLGENVTFFQSRKVFGFTEVSFQASKRPTSL